jgi:hypothetical protein
MMKILDLLQNSVSRLETPRVHLFRDTTDTMELARHKLPRNGYSKLLHPQSDLGKEIQVLHNSLRITFCTTRRPEVQSQFDSADDFSTEIFPSNKSYPPAAGITFTLVNKTYGFIPEAHLLDRAHSPAIKSTIMLNSKLSPQTWSLVDWDLWGRSASELNATKLLSVIKFVHK